MRSASHGQGGEGAARPGSRDLRQLRRLAGYLRPYRWQVAATLVALALAAAAVLVFGIGLRYLIDGGFAAGRTDALDHALKASLIVVVVLAGRDLRARLPRRLARRAPGRRPARRGLRPRHRPVAGASSRPPAPARCSRA